MTACHRNSDKPITSVQFTHSVVSNYLQPHGLQHASLLCPSPTPRSCSNSCPWVADTIQPSHPLLSPSPAFNNLSQHQGLFHWVLRIRWPKYWSFSFNIEAYTAAAKSLQSCPTLCDPIDSSPPGSPLPGILQARTLEWVAISFSNAWKWKWKWSHSVVSDSQQPHGLQPTRLLHPWDFLGKSTGVGCH